MSEWGRKNAGNMKKKHIKGKSNLFPFMCFSVMHGGSRLRLFRAIP